MNTLRYMRDTIRSKNDDLKINASNPRIDSKIDIFYTDTGERLFEPLHNKTVIAGSALTAMKLFALDRNSLDNTPTYDTTLNLLNGADGSTYPTLAVKDKNGMIVGSVPDETQRIICGFCIGQGGAGLDSSDIFNVEYDSWITPDNLIPFRYPVQSADTVDESIYKGKKLITLSNGQERNAYYFKTFSNTPYLSQNYVSSIGSFTDSITANTVYGKTTDSKAQSYVELHLKITDEDVREFFIAHKGLEGAKVNQISLVSAWSKSVSVTKPDDAGNSITKTVEYLQDIRPFSLLNMNESLNDLSKSISIIYTLYF